MKTMFEHEQHDAWPNEPERARDQGSLADAYRAMAADEQAEREAYEWTENLIGETL